MQHHDKDHRADPLASASNRALPWPFRAIYPELRFIGSRSEQFKFLVEATANVTPLFSSILIIALLLFGNAIEAHIKRALGISGSLSDAVAAGVFILLMVGILSWMIIRDLSKTRCIIRTELLQRGHELCVECGYDLRGQQQLRCPECGASVVLPKEQLDAQGEGG
jgi:predicted RNA-binding Zn-ribbon protein involved in translation (DUF1610 family)